MIKNISYTFDPFFRSLEEKGYSELRFANKYNVSRSTLYKLHNNGNVNIQTILQLMLHLQVDDITKIIEIIVVK